MKLIKVIKKVVKVGSRFCIKQVAHIDGNAYTRLYTAYQILTILIQHLICHECFMQMELVSTLIHMQ